MQPYYEMESKQKEDFFYAGSPESASGNKVLLEEDRTGQDRTGQDRTGQDSFVNHSAKAEFRTSATPELAALCRFI
jgi:hypothetical protein